MSQHISDIGTIHAPLESGSVPEQENSVGSPARKVLHDAPPLMEKSLDEARPMTDVPDRDVPEAVLERRNEETEETLIVRELTSSIERNDGPSARAAAERLEGHPLSPQMQSLVRRAGTIGNGEDSGLSPDAPTVSDAAERSSAPEGSPQAGPEEAPHAAPRAPEPEGTDGDASAPNAATTTTVSSSRAPRRRASGTDDAAATTTTTTTTTVSPFRARRRETSAATTTTTTTTTTTAVDDDFDDFDELLPGEERMRELEVPEELIVVLGKYRPGMFYSERLSLEEMRALNGRIAGLLDQPSLQDADGGSETALIRMLLFKMQAQLKIGMESRTHLETLTDSLRTLSADPARSRAEKLNALADMALIWRHGREQTQTLRRLEARDPQSLQYAAEGTSVVGDDLDALEEALVEAAARELDALQNERPARTDAGGSSVAPSSADTPLSGESLLHLARLALHAGERPEVVLDHVRNGLSWAFSADHHRDLTALLTEGLAQAAADMAAAQAAGSRDIAGLIRATEWIDMAFQGAYPDFADDALSLKKMVAPGYENEIEMQHSCLLASRQLLNMLESGSAPSGRTRTDAVARTMQRASSASARSFVLTPDIVTALTRKTNIPDFNFHLAHVALLQKRAAEYGFLAVSDADRARMSDAAAWCRELHLGEAAAQYAARLSRDLADPALRLRCERELEEACDRFAQGFSGMNDLVRAGVTLEARAGMTGSLRSSSERALYETSPEYLARVALDHHIVNLTGLIRPDQRFAHDGMTLNGEAVDRAMRRETRSLYNAIFVTGSPEQARRAVDERSEVRRGLLAETHLFEARAHTMNTLARGIGEGLRLRSRIVEDTRTFNAMKEEKSLLSFTWPHRRSARLRNSETVLRIARLHEELSALPAGAPERSSLERDIRDLLGGLTGVSPFTLAPSLRRRGQAVTLETVLEQMLPRARAVAFFDRKIYVAGRPTTRAMETLDRIIRDRNALDRLQSDIEHSMKDVIAQFGKDNILRLQQTIAAALYKVFAESGRRASDFTVADGDTLDAVRHQLETWGMPVDEGLTPMLIRLTLASLTRFDGTLKPDVLRSEAERTKLAFAGKAGVETMKQGLRHAGLSRFSAWNETRRFINESLLPDERRRTEGVRSLLRQASLPGSGFTYDRTNGLVADTGVVFTPFSAPGQPVNFVDLSHPLSVRMRLMKNNTMTVSNMGNGCYQVLLKGGFATSLGATIKLSLPGTGVTFSLGGNAGTRGEDGLALTFSSQADCEKFLVDFMKPDSELHRLEEAGPASSWLAASQIRFINGRTVSLDASAGVMYSLFKQALGVGFSTSGSLSFTVNAASDITRQVEQNASGETTTFSVRGKVGAASSVSFGLTHTSTAGDQTISVMAGSPLLNLGGSREMTMEQRFKICTGPQGISPATCMETEYTAASFGALGMRDIGRWLLLPDEVKNRMADNPAFADAFTRLMHDIPKSARLVVRRALRPKVLSEVRGLFVTARMAADEKTKNEALKAAHDLLAAFDSYTPVSISVRNASSAEDISRNWSPGLAAFQYSRNRSFVRADAGKTLEIPLPRED